jgi:hypothetical protein
VVVELVSSKGAGPVFVAVRLIDFTDEEKRELITFQKLANIAEGGHAISAIGGLLKPALMEALKLAGLVFS